MKESKGWRIDLGMLKSSIRLKGIVEDCGQKRVQLLHGILESYEGMKNNDEELRVPKLIAFLLLLLNYVRNNFSVVSAEDTLKGLSYPSQCKF